MKRFTLHDFRKRMREVLSAATTERPEVEIVDEEGHVVMRLWIPATAVPMPED